MDGKVHEMVMTKNLSCVAKQSNNWKKAENYGNWRVVVLLL